MTQTCELSVTINVRWKCLRPQIAVTSKIYILRCHLNIYTCQICHADHFISIHMRSPSMKESEMPPVKAGNLEANGGNTACGVEIIYSTSTVTQIFHQELLVAFGADLFKCRSAPSRTHYATRSILFILSNGVKTMEFRYSTVSFHQHTHDRYSITCPRMMTSGNGNIFHVTGPLCGEFTGHRWIRLTNASDAELWSAPEQTVEKTIETPLIWDAIALIITSL